MDDNVKKICPCCAEQISSDAKICPYCGERIEENIITDEVNGVFELPKEYDKFNWGAFWLNWIWGLGNRSYITFLAIPAAIINLFIPFMSIGVSIWFGIQGNKWAWKNTEWIDIYSFNETQKKWAIWGTICGILFSLIKYTLLILLAFHLVSVINAPKIYSESQSCREYKKLDTYLENKPMSEVMKYSEKLQDLKQDCGMEVLKSYFNSLMTNGLNNKTTTKYQLKQKTASSSKTSSNYQVGTTDFAPYMNELQTQIGNNWHPPKGDVSRNVLVLFTVDKDGELLNVKIIKSSGSAEMDDAALSTLKQSAPFPPLPQSYNKESVDIQFSFDYNVWNKK